MAARLRALFGTRAPGAFMDDSVFGEPVRASRQKSVTLKAEPTPVTVLPLPVADRPANFSGAVGQFQVASELDTRPRLRRRSADLQIDGHGQGNLSRVSSDALQDSAQWRVYRAESKVTADDDSGLQGFKTFTQPVVPLQAGQLTLPGLSFSYFDPEAGRYSTRETPPISVTRHAGRRLNPGGRDPARRRGTGGRRSRRTADAWRRTWRRGGPCRDAGTLVWRPWFIGAAVVPVVLMLCAVTLDTAPAAARRRSGAGAACGAPGRGQNQSRGHGRRNESGRLAAFFSAARHALQEKLADLWQVPAESVDAQLLTERFAAGAGGIAGDFRHGRPGHLRPAKVRARSSCRQWQRRVLAQMDQPGGQRVKILRLRPCCCARMPRGAGRSPAIAAAAAAAAAVTTSWRCRTMSRC